MSKYSKNYNPVKDLYLPNIKTGAKKLITDTANATDYTIAEVKDIYLYMMHFMREYLLQGYEVILPGIGKLHKCRTKPRVFPSRKMNRDFVIMSTTKISFKPTEKFKSYLRYSRRYGLDRERTLLFTFGCSIDGRITKEMYEKVLEREGVTHEYVLGLVTKYTPRPKNLREYWTPEQWRNYEQKLAAQEAKLKDMQEDEVFHELADLDEDGDVDNDVIAEDGTSLDGIEQQMDDENDDVDVNDDNDADVVG